MKFEYQTDNPWREAAIKMKGSMAGAARRAMQQLARDIQTQARAEIARAGLSKRWQTGFTTSVAPRRPDGKLDITIRGKHRIGYANIFERGGTIRPKGRSRLWIPLPSAPKKINGTRTTAGLFAAQVAPLISFHRSGGAPLLGAYLNRAPVGRSATVGQLKAGAAKAGRGSQRGRTVKPVLVPMFVGVTSVQVRDRLDVSAIYDQARLNLAALYYAERRRNS